MKIRVNEKWRIKGNASSWRVQEFKGLKKDGSKEWGTHYWHADFADALESLSEHRVRISDAETPERIKLALVEIASECRRARRTFQSLSSGDDR